MSVVVGLGLVIGVLLGLLGGGGSILAVPALVYGAGQPLSSAIPTSLAVVAVSAASGVLPRLRSGQVQWRIAGVFGATGTVAAFLGTAVNRLLPERVVLLGFAVLMVAAGVRMLRRTDVVGGDCALPGGGVNWRGCLPKSVGAGAAVGFLTGLFGVGGGFLVLPALVLLLGLPMDAAVGTSLVIVTVNSTAGFVAHLGSASLDLPVLLAFTAAAVAGSLVAGRLGGAVRPERLQRGFAVLVLGVAGLVAAQSLA